MPVYSWKQDKCRCCSITNMRKDLIAAWRNGLSTSSKGSAKVSLVSHCKSGPWCSHKNWSSRYIAAKKNARIKTPSKGDQSQGWTYLPPATCLATLFLSRPCHRCSLPSTACCSQRMPSKMTSLLAAELRTDCRTLRGDLASSAVFSSTAEDAISAYHKTYGLHAPDHWWVFQLEVAMCWIILPELIQQLSNGLLLAPEYTMLSSGCKDFSQIFAPVLWTLTCQSMSWAGCNRVTYSDFSRWSLCPLRQQDFSKLTTTLRYL